MRPLLALATVALLAGCAAVGPTYHLPTAATINAPAAQGRFVGATDNRAVSQDEGPDAWWRLYDDPRLDALVQAALVANTDLRVAEANLERSRALLQEAKAARRPQVAFSGAEEEAQLSAQAYLLDQPIPVTGLYDVGLTVSYDLDLFGRIRRGIEAARADDEAVEAARDLVRVNVAAEVTRAYVDACGSGAEIAAARRILALQQQSFGQTQRLVHAGRGGALDLVRSQGLIDQSRANIPALLARQRNAEFRLATLTGRPPAAFDQSLEHCAAAPVLKQPIPVGDGASLLKRRPDVRAAERRLAAATAVIGVRTAALYPDVSLGASVGSTGANQSAFSDITNFWSIGPSIGWKLDHTADRARIEEAKAETKVDLARFDRKRAEHLQPRPGARRRSASRRRPRPPGLRRRRAPAARGPHHGARHPRRRADRSQPRASGRRLQDPARRRSGRAVPGAGGWLEERAGADDRRAVRVSSRVWQMISCATREDYG
jgi:NodT family efflux transporter outer membrane factor (OMF) lipoprotein